MDEIDRRIIEILRKNGRMPFTKLAERLGITEGAVRHRVKSLTARGIIKRFTLEISEEGTTTLIGMKTNPKINLQELCSKILKIKEVERVFEITGDLDLIAIVRSTNPQNLNRIVDSLRSIPGVTSTISYLVLKEYGD